MFAKIDLSDGSWRMIVRESDKWNFAFVLPGAAGNPVRLIILHALQMGWTESPGYFCATTKTGRSLTGAAGYPHMYSTRTCPPTQLSAARVLPRQTDHGRCRPSMLTITS
jgi:hypothetical protein